MIGAAIEVEVLDPDLDVVGLPRTIGTLVGRDVRDVEEDPADLLGQRVGLRPELLFLLAEVAAALLERTGLVGPAVLVERRPPPWRSA